MKKTSREIAVKCRDHIRDHDSSEEMRDLIMETMIGVGAYDEWLDVFRDDEDMLGRFKANKHRIIPREPLLVDYTDRR